MSRCSPWAAAAAHHGVRVEEESCTEATGFRARRPSLGRTGLPLAVRASHAHGGERRVPIPGDGRDGGDAATVQVHRRRSTSMWLVAEAEEDDCGIDDCGRLSSIK